MNTLYIDGVDLWAPALPGWGAAAPALRGEPLPPAPPARPATTLLAGNERRRAPATVLAALSVAEQAVAMAGRPAASLASVFTSTHGDLSIVDALCTTLASDPLLLSPTRFHHSVHNAASGYWAIATGSHEPGSAVAHFGAAFAAGLLEALTLCSADGIPVLLVGFDAEASGALASVNRSRGLLGAALVLSPDPSRARWQLDWAVTAPGPSATRARSAAAQALGDNAMADGLPLFEALAHSVPAALTLTLGGVTALELRVQPRTRPAAALPPSSA